MSSSTTSVQGPGLDSGQGPPRRVRRSRLYAMKGSKRSRTEIETPFGAPPNRLATLQDPADLEVGVPGPPTAATTAIHQRRPYGPPSGRCAPRGAWILSCSAVGSLQSRCARSTFAGGPDHSSIAPSAPDQLFTARGRARTSASPIPSVPHSAACWFLGDVAESLSHRPPAAPPAAPLSLPWRGGLLRPRAEIPNLLPQLGLLGESARPPAKKLDGPKARLAWEARRWAREEL